MFRPSHPPTTQCSVPVRSGNVRLAEADIHLPLWAGPCELDVRILNAAGAVVAVR